MDKNFNKITNEIKNSDVFENSKNWEVRGLNPSDKTIILILRSATNDFLEQLVLIQKSNNSDNEKLNQISNIVDNLPWDKLDTEEKEFLADVLAPAIQSLGFNPWTIF